MREIKLASLLVLGAFTFIACDSDDGDSDDTGSGVGASTGSGATGAGAASGDGTGGSDGDGSGATGGDGDNDTAVPEGCGSLRVVTADGTIDSFNHGESPAIPDGGEGVLGEWSHGSNQFPAGGGLLDFPTEAGGMGGGPAYLEAKCVDGDTDNSPQCNAAWDSASPWAQYASIETLMAPYAEPDLACADASAFTGIKFMGKSPDGDKLIIQLGTPQSDSMSGETYKSQTLTLTSEWTEFEVPFSGITQPSWSSITAPLDLKSLQSLAFVVRTVTPQADPEGEKLEAYDISIDDVSFY